MRNENIKSEYQDVQRTGESNETISRTRNSYNRKRKRSGKKSLYFSGFFIKVIISIMMVIIIAIVKGSNNSWAKEISDKVEKVMNWNYNNEKIKTDIAQKLGKITDKNILLSQKIDESIPTVDNIHNFDLLTENKLDYGGEVEEDKPIENNFQSNEGEVSTDNLKVKDEGFVLPTNGPLGSKFGNRVHPIKKTVEFHYGIDIEANKGSSIVASLGGEVMQAGFEKSLGNYVKLKHGNGFETTYAHCSVLKCKNKQKVNKGDIIALVGDTGAAQGPHLHFEIWKNGKAVNPEVYLTNK